MHTFYVGMHKISPGMIVRIRGTSDLYLVVHAANHGLKLVCTKSLRAYPNQNDMFIKHEVVEVIV